jgi:hypothetical protein
MSKNPSDLRVDIRIGQINREGTIGTTWPQIHPHGHFSLMEQLNPTTEKGPQEVRVRQPSSQQLLNDLTQVLEPMEVSLGHIIPPSWVGGRGSYP